MPRARYKQVVDRWAADIRSGRWSPGARLPTHRQLAAQEQLSLVTATRVYAELEAMGLVSGEPGRGTFVREVALPRHLGIDQHATAAGLLDLNFNYPSLPGQADLLRQALRQLASAGDLEALLQPGDVVAIDALSYPGFKVLAEQQRLELAALPAAGNGPDLDALEALCQRRRVRAIYAIPTLHNPLGWVMAPDQRSHLVALARRHGLLVIEDAAYAFLEDQPPAPLAALLPESSVYVSGFSKSVATGLRVGFVVAPPDWVPRLERAIRATTWNTPGLTTAITLGWLADGTVARLEAEKRLDAQARQRLAAEVLGDHPRIAHPASYFLWLPLGEDVRADRMAMGLMEMGVSVTTAEPFAMAAPVPHALRLALGSLPLDRLRDALERVRALLDAPPLTAPQRPRRAIAYARQNLAS